LKSLAEQILHFLFTIDLNIKLPRHVEVMDVYKDVEVQKTCRQFYSKYYNDQQPRILLLGINPGRYGGGITGIPFTDPINLEKFCSIQNNWKKQQELSSLFIYEMIEAFGGTQLFYQQFYISAVSPLGFVKEGKNLNYYDDKLLLKRIEPFVIKWLKQQIEFGLNTNVCFCIGEGENFKYLNKLNDKHQFFHQVKSLPHPRFIMQYRLKKKQDYIQLYKNSLSVSNL
jgi:Domain of unknown function (DUF4918)